jgi:hypothetical protein
MDATSCLIIAMAKECRVALREWENTDPVDRRLVIGTRERLTDMLYESEDSEKLNTAFVERLNLTIREGSSYLRRKSSAHAREGEYLHDHLSLLHCYYNFIRPHRALRIGAETWTPAMMAGIATRKHTFRSLFECVAKMSARFSVCWSSIQTLLLLYAARLVTAMKSLAGCQRTENLAGILATLSKSNRISVRWWPVEKCVAVTSWAA